MKTTVPGQLPDKAWQEVQGLPGSLLHVRPGKYSAVPHGDQADSWMQKRRNKRTCSSSPRVLGKYTGAQLRYKQIIDSDEEDGGCCSTKRSSA